MKRPSNYTTAKTTSHERNEKNLWTRIAPREPITNVQNEFYEGFSIPRNKELMRIYKDLELVEQWGSGVPRILEYYGKECFKFSENFLRMVFPAAERVTPQATPRVRKLLEVLTREQNRSELQEKLGLSDREHFRKSYLQPAIEQELIDLTIPDKPKSSKQGYRLTIKGQKFLKINEIHRRNN